MKKSIAASTVVVAAAALLVSSVGAAAPTPKLPKRWRGNAVYTYTYNGDDQIVQQTVSASVVLVPVKGWTGTYGVSSGTIKSDYTSKTPDGCTTTSSGSYSASKYLLTLQVDSSRRPRASFSAQEGAVGAPVPATQTCPDGTSQTTSMGVENPFFMLSRHTTGFPVNASLTRISGSLRTAQSGGVWTVRFSLVGKK
jgi:hypothetical protein